MLVHEKNIFLNSPSLPLFAPYWAPIGVSPLILQIESPFPNDASYQILVEIGSMVLEKKSFKGKVYGRRTVTDTYSSLEHSAQVS